MLAGIESFYLAGLVFLMIDACGYGMKILDSLFLLGLFFSRNASLSCRVGIRHSVTFPLSSLRVNSDRIARTQQRSRFQWGSVKSGLFEFEFSCYFPNFHGYDVWFQTNLCWNLGKPQIYHFTPPTIPTFSDTPCTHCSCPFGFQ